MALPWAVCEALTVVTTYKSLMSLPRRFYANPYNIMIVPAFSFARHIVKRINFRTLKDYVN